MLQYKTKMPANIVLIGLDTLPEINYNKKSSINDPSDTMDPDTIYKCKVCIHYSTGDMDRMTRHIRVHQGLNPYKCFMCDYSTVNSVLFQEHVNIHQGVKPYKCQHCDYRSVSKKYLKKHEDRHCVCECGYIAKNTKALYIHKNLLCKSATIKEQTKLKKKENIKCTICSRFISSPKFELHQKGITPCDICGIMCCSLSRTAHLKKTHGVGVSKEFKCAICGWRSSFHKKVLLHLIHHPGQEVDERVFDLTILKKYGIMS